MTLSDALARAPRWLSADDAADHLGVGTETFRRLVRRGKMPAANYTLGKQSPRWDRVAIDRMMGAVDAVNGMEEIYNALCQDANAEAEGGQKAPRERRDQGIQV